MLAFLMIDSALPFGVFEVGVGLLSFGTIGFTLKTFYQPSTFGSFSFLFLTFEIELCTQFSETLFAFSLVILYSKFFAVAHDDDSDVAMLHEEYQ